MRALKFASFSVASYAKHIFDLLPSHHIPVTDVILSHRLSAMHVLALESVCDKRGTDM